MQQTMAAAGAAKWADRSIDRYVVLITQETKVKPRNIKLGGGLQGGDGRDDVIGIEEQEEQVPAKGGRTNCAADRTKLEAVVINRK